MPRSITSRLGFPRVGAHRRFMTAIGIDAMGSGVWMPISMTFFLATTDLSLVQVRLALALSLSLSSLLSLPAVLLAASRRQGPRPGPDQNVDPAEVAGGWGIVLRDRGYRWLVATNFAYAMVSAVLNVAIPV